MTLTYKSLVTQIVVALVAFAAIASCDKAAAQEHSHTSEEVLAADHAELTARIHAARCYIYESMSTNKTADLEIFKRRIKGPHPVLLYNLGYAKGQVVATAYNIVANYNDAIHAAAQTWYRREKCNPVESI